MFDPKDESNAQFRVTQLAITSTQIREETFKARRTLQLKVLIALIKYKRLKIITIINNKLSDLFYYNFKSMSYERRKEEKLFYFNSLWFTAWHICAV